MPVYRIHRMRESARQQFRWAAHISGVTEVKPRDYMVDGSVEASSPYAAWSSLRDSPATLRPGDMLESESGGIRIFKYVGFDEARWIMPEVSSGIDLEGLPPASGGTPTPTPPAG